MGSLSSGLQAAFARDSVMCHRGLIRPCTSATTVRLGTITCLAQHFKYIPQRQEHTPHCISRDSRYIQNFKATTKNRQYSLHYFSSHTSASSTSNLPKQHDRFHGRQSHGI